MHTTSSFTTRARRLALCGLTLAACTAPALAADTSGIQVYNSPATATPFIFTTVTFPAHAAWGTAPPVATGDGAKIAVSGLYRVAYNCPIWFQNTGDVHSQVLVNTNLVPATLTTVVMTPNANDIRPIAFEGVAKLAVGDVVHLQLMSSAYSISSEECSMIVSLIGT